MRIFFWVDCGSSAVAVVGTRLGEGSGTAIGPEAGNPGIGAAIGAGADLLGETASRASAASATGWEASLPPPLPPPGLGRLRQVSRPFGDARHGDLHSLGN